MPAQTNAQINPDARKTMNGVECPVTFVDSAMAASLFPQDKQPIGFGVDLVQMDDGAETICLAMTKPGHGAAVAMLSIDQFDFLCHKIADLIEAANTRDRPASMETVQ